MKVFLLDGETLDCLANSSHLSRFFSAAEFGPGAGGFAAGVADGLAGAVVAGAGTAGVAGGGGFPSRLRPALRVFFFFVRGPARAVRLPLSSCPASLFF